MRRILVLTFGGMLLAPAAAAVLEQPVARQAIVLPAARSNPKAVIRRTCLRFSRLMVRATREADRPFEEYSVVPAGAHACERESGDVIHLGYWTELLGVKDRYVFLAQRTSGVTTVQVGVLSSRSGNTFFHEPVNGPFVVVEAGPGRFKVRFRRQFTSDCSLYYGAATACWAKIKAATGLADAMLPDCRGAYEAAKRQRRVADITGYPAAVSYEAEASYRAGALTYRALPGRVACAPE